MASLVTQATSPPRTKEEFLQEKLKNLLFRIDERWNNLVADVNPADIPKKYQMAMQHSLYTQMRQNLEMLKEPAMMAGFVEIVLMPYWNKTTMEFNKDLFKANQKKKTELLIKSLYQEGNPEEGEAMLKAMEKDLDQDVMQDLVLEYFGMFCHVMSIKN